MAKNRTMSVLDRSNILDSFPNVKMMTEAIIREPGDIEAWFRMTDAFIDDSKERSSYMLKALLGQLDPYTYSKDTEKKLQAMLLDKGEQIIMPKVVNSIGMEFVCLPPGINVMGSPDDEPHRHQDEGPQHLVRMPSIFMATYPITQREWEAVMGNNPSTSHKHPNHPVENVSWHDAKEFCKKLSELPEEMDAGRMYDLPGEYDWEWACRAGTRSPYAFGDTLTHEMANFDEKINRTTPVGSYPANLFGLHDMHGNVWEWCDDLYDSDRYTKEIEAAKKAGTAIEIDL